MEKKCLKKKTMHNGEDKVNLKKLRHSLLLLRVQALHPRLEFHQRFSFIENTVNRFQEKIKKFKIILRVSFLFLLLNLIPLASKKSPEFIWTDFISYFLLLFFKNQFSFVLGLVNNIINRKKKTITV